MAQGIHMVHGEEIVMTPIVAKNSEVFALYSPVTVDSNGFLAVCTSSGEKVYGYVTEAFTAAAANQTGTAGTYQTTDNTSARYAPRVIAPNNVDFWADSDLAYTDTDAGAYADVASVSSGVVTLNLAAGATGQFAVLGLLSSANPSAEGDTDRIIVRAAERTVDGYAQS